MRRPLATRVALVTLGFSLLTACGGGGDSETDGAAPTTASSATVPRDAASSTTTSTLPASPTTTAVADPTGSPLSARSRIHLRGVGPVTAGMTVRQAEEAAGVALQVENFEPFDGLCYYAIPVGFEGIGFMVGAPDGVRPEDPLDGVILRAEARSAPWQTISGIKVGSTAAEVAEAYGQRIETEPHAYQPGGEYLTLTGTGADAGFGVRFETDPGHVVENIFAGDTGAITATEGCA